MEDVLEKLEGIRRSGDGRWAARCPAHGDRSPSLSIRQGDDGRILLHCFSGCAFGEVLAALGLEPAQLFPPSVTPWRPTRPRPDPQREARALAHRLSALRADVEPAQLRDDLVLVGRMILGGTAAYPALQPALAGIRTTPLRLIAMAAGDLVRQGTPRRWFSPLAISREFDRTGGPGSAKGWAVFYWCKAAAREAARS